MASRGTRARGPATQSLHFQMGLARQPHPDQSLITQQIFSPPSPSCGGPGGSRISEGEDRVVRGVRASQHFWLGGGVGGGWPGVLVLCSQTVDLLSLTEDRACDCRHLCVHPVSPVWWFCVGDGPHLVSMSTHSTLSAGLLAIWSKVPTVT